MTQGFCYFIDVGYELACAGNYTRIHRVGNNWASTVQRSLAEHRGHAIERDVVLPSFLNNVTWRSLYVVGGRAYVDKIRVPWFGRGCASEGASAALVPAPDLASLHPGVARGERLIRWFSDDWVALDPDDPSVLGDLRYSFSPQKVTPIWGIRKVPATALPPLERGSSGSTTTPEETSAGRSLVA